MPIKLTITGENKTEGWFIIKLFFILSLHCMQVLFMAFLKLVLLYLCITFNYFKDIFEIYGGQCNRI